MLKFSGISNIFTHLSLLGIFSPKSFLSKNAMLCSNWLIILSCDWLVLGALICPCDWMLAVSASEEISSWENFQDEVVVDEWTKYKNITKRRASHLKLI